MRKMCAFVVRRNQKYIYNIVRRNSSRGDYTHVIAILNNKHYRRSPNMSIAVSFTRMEYFLSFIKKTRVPESHCAMTKRIIILRDKRGGSSAC